MGGFSYIQNYFEGDFYEFHWSSFIFADSVFCRSRE